MCCNATTNHAHCGNAHVRGDSWLEAQVCTHACWNVLHVYMNTYHVTTCPWWHACSPDNGPLPVLVLQDAPTSVQAAYAQLHPALSTFTLWFLLVHVWPDKFGFRLHIHALGSHMLKAMISNSWMATRSAVRK